MDLVAHPKVTHVIFHIILFYFLVLLTELNYFVSSFFVPYLLLSLYLGLEMRLLRAVALDSYSPWISNTYNLVRHVIGVHERS